MDYTKYIAAFTLFCLTLTTYSQNTLPSLEMVLAKQAKVDSLEHTSGSNGIFRAPGVPQDCDEAIPVCSQSYTQTTSYIGDGDGEEVFNGCLASGETNSVWYIFTCQTTGNFGFDLVTTNDYDWALFDLSNNSCADVPSMTPIRCNFSATAGSTGMDGTGTNPSEDEFGGPYSTELAVVAGETYVLIIDNWTADATGYTLNFTTGGGYTSIVDVTPPVVATVLQSCVNGDIVTLTLSEEIQCSSIEAGGSDFSITGAGTPAVLGAAGVNCTGTLTSEIDITFDNSPQITSGTYTLTVNIGSDANTLLDKCDNSVVVATTANFEYLAPITLTPDVSAICNSGDPVVLTAIGHSAGETYTLTPGGTSNTTGIFNVNPTVTTTYTVSATLGSCTQTASTTITLVDNVVVSISPIDPTICSGTTTLTASATVNGAACPTCLFDWDNDGTGDFDDAAGITEGVGTYQVDAQTVEGCPSSNTAVSIISLASAGGGASCDVLYVSPAGGGDGLTKANPTDLVSALTAALCTNTIIKMQTGSYPFSAFITINSFVTLEGGYNAGFTIKTSDLTDGNATTIERNNTVDSDDTKGCTAFRVVAGATGFRFQDLRIEMPTNHSNSTEVTNYGIKLGAGCSGYNIVRCYIDGGTGANP